MNNQLKLASQVLLLLIVGLVIFQLEFSTDGSVASGGSDAEFESVDMPIAANGIKDQVFIEDELISTADRLLENGTNAVNSSRLVNPSEAPIDLSSFDAAPALKAHYQSNKRTLSISVPLNANRSVEAVLYARSPFAEGAEVYVDGEPVPSETSKAKFYLGSVDGDRAATTSLQLDASGDLSGFLSFAGENYRIGYSDAAFSKELIERSFREDLIGQLDLSDGVAVPRRAVPVSPASGEKVSSADGLSSKAGSNVPVSAALTGEIGILNQSVTSITQVEGWSDLYYIDVPEGQAVLTFLTDKGGWVNFYVSTTSDPATESNYCGEGFEECILRSPDAGRYYVRAAIGANEGDLALAVGFATALPIDERIQVKVAIDSDASFLGLFGQDSVTAGNYVGQLFNYIAPLWDGELRAELVVGDIHLHTSDEPANVSLESVSSHFDANHNRGDHAVVHFLTTRFGGGVAYLGVMCDATYGYGISGIDGFAPNPGEALTWDPNVVAHELGHNLGSPHTHDSGAWNGNPIDQCTSGNTAEYLPGVDL